MSEVSEYVFPLCPLMSVAVCTDAGTRTATTLTMSKDELICAAAKLKLCSEKQIPPAKKHIPRTSKRLLNMEPMTAQKM
jgi:hypothetical protein